MKYALGILVLGVTLARSPAYAQEAACPAEGMSWLRLEAESSLSRSWAASVAAHLELELASRGIALCLAPMRPRNSLPS